jgi:hypothetical protein
MAPAAARPVVSLDEPSPGDTQSPVLRRANVRQVTTAMGPVIEGSLSR